MSRWFRLYDDMIHDAKILRLSDEMFRAWITLLCLASKNEGKLPPAADIAATLREKQTKVATWIAALRGGGLLDEVDGVFVPHNWEGRQFKSDSSNERVKRYRQRKCNVTEAVTVTAPETEADTEQKQSRTDTRDGLQKREGDFCQAIVRTYAECNSPTLPDTSRAKLWLSQGYDPEICLAVIAQIVPRKPNVSLSYFDGPIRDAHSNTAPARKSISPPKDDGLIEVLDQWALDAWSKYERDNGLKQSPRNKRGGWRFPSKWPPGYEDKMVDSVKKLVASASN